MLLLVIALETAGWQVHYGRTYDGPGYPPHLYRHLLTGEGTLSALLAAPFAYAAWATAALAAACAVPALRRTPAARPLGLALGLLVLLDGVVALCGWHTAHLLFATHDVPGAQIAEQSFAVFHVAAGALLLVLLAQRAGHRPAGRPTPAGRTVPAGRRTPAGRPGCHRRRPRGGLLINSLHRLRDTRGIRCPISRRSTGCSDRRRNCRPICLPALLPDRPGPHRPGRRP